MDKKNLSEQDIRTKFITPAIVAAGWDLQLQIREEVTFTKGRVIVRGELHARGEARRADYVLYHQDSGLFNLSVGKIRGIPVEVPPAEQPRIVIKVTELLALCDQLMAHIAADRAKQAQLAETLVSQAVAA